ncbi:MAG: DUF2130 domain-containing protein [Tenericutes bacterium]|nr:DUF2130 domain-containing protein [Mycoplasmatota bacterium]
MNEIKCPKCGTVFEIDEASYDSIVKQIRDREFDKEVNLREEQHKLDKENSIKLAEAHIKEELGLKLNEKDLEISELKLSLKTKEEQATNKVEKEYQEKLNKLLLEITELKNKIQLQESKNELDIEKAVSEKNQKISDLSSELALKGKEFELKENTIKESYESKLKAKDEQIAYYKDFKAKQSTKMIGESLEQHCSVEFNRLRPLFKNAYFEKDNDARTGSKGDFIFRDYDDEGNEIVSIMFEMKNEADKTATKHKNEDFLKELDKDRKEKKCEYAVLVSLLEADNDYYNDGIVDVSHLYDKMYVIRPQFFIPLITLIRNLANKSLEYKKELDVIKNQNIDITHFEENINTFKEGFGRNYRLAAERFQKAIEEIDKTIDHLQKTKEHLLKTNDNLRLANNKAEDLTIKRLTHNNPTMSKMFEELEKDNLVEE